MMVVVMGCAVQRVMENGQDEKYERHLISGDEGAAALAFFEYMLVLSPEVATCFSAEGEKAVVPFDSRPVTRQVSLLR